MRKIPDIFLFILIAAAIVLIAVKGIHLRKNSTAPATSSNSGQDSAPSNTNQAESQTGSSATDQNPASAQTNNQANPSQFQPPLDLASERVTKKPFGIYVSPQNSPVQPERFQGYHTGADFEIFPDELNADVPVSAICTGTIALKEYASGYGGALVQNCMLDTQPITVIYGHLKLASISKSAGQTLDVGETIGILGKAFSSETDGERKHLHLGIHKGSSVNIRGYVASKSDLSNWIDPCTLVCK
jgi:hypothetical protein